MKSGIHVSVIIPTRNRPRETRRAVESLTHQYLQSWEVILVDDASDDATTDVVKQLARMNPNVVDLYFDKKQERVISYNTGIKYARGKWIYMLDSDDEVPSHFIKVIEQQIEANPEAKSFMWGSVIHCHDDGKYKYTETESGIPVKEFAPASGRFIFKKELIDQIGYLPEARNAYTFTEKVRSWYPDINTLIPEGKKNLGAPWGQDWVWFQRVLSVADPILIPQLLHIKHHNNARL